MKLFVIAMAAAAAAAVVALGGVGRPDAARGEAPPPTRRTVTVTGTGSVETVPDRARLSLGVRTQAETADEAVDRLRERMGRVVKALFDAGVARKDIQSEDISLEPRLKRGEGIVGYTASATVAASAKLDELGGALDSAVAAGANQTYGLSLTRSESDEDYRDALRDALADARENARALAAAGGFDVGEIVRVDESQAESPEYGRYYALAAAPTASMPIEPGTQKIEASVSVVFAIR